MTAPTGNPRGRPSTYTPEIANAICARMADGESLRSICRDESTPSMATVMRWARENPVFREQYVAAREDLLAHRAEELDEIADEKPRLVKNSAGEFMVDSGAETHRKTRIDTRKWILSKLLPKVYGDRVTGEFTGKDGAPLIPAAAPPDSELARRLLFLLEKGAAAAAQPPQT